MDNDTLCKKLEDAIYEEALEPKIKLLKDINSHKDRVKVYDRERIISAILRTLAEVDPTQPGTQEKP